MFKFTGLFLLISLSSVSFADQVTYPLQDNPLENLTDSQIEARKAVMESFSSPDNGNYDNYHQRIKTDPSFRQQLGMSANKYTTEQKAERKAFKDAYQSADEATKAQMKEQLNSDANLRTRLGINN
jgi:hypothetical protein